MAKLVPQAPRRGPSWKDVLTIWSPSILVMLAGFAIAWWFVEPAPENHLKIATGTKSGNYYVTAQKYAEVFRKQGIDLEIVETAGTIENYKLLQEDPSIQLAIVQGGAQPQPMIDKDLEAIASLYFEPLWVFHRAGEDYSRLRNLDQKRVSIGLPDSGTEALMLRLLAANGLLPDQDQSEADRFQVELFRETSTEGIELLLAGERDVVCLVTSPTNLQVKELFENSEVEVLPIELNKTYRLLFPSLSGIELQAGILDLPKKLPENDVELIAPAANLVCTPELHDAFVPLLLNAATQTHSKGNLLVPPGTFPSLDYVEFDVHRSALDYFQSGPSFLNRYLPFWAASFLNRMKIMLVPLLTLAIPLFKLAPPVYRWRIRSRIYRWYGLLRQIDQEQLNDDTPELRQQHLEQLNEMARELNEVNVPLGYMEEFYNLHLHIDLIRRRVLESPEEKVQS